MVGPWPTSTGQSGWRSGWFVDYFMLCLFVFVVTHIDHVDTTVLIGFEPLFYVHIYWPINKLIFDKKFPNNIPEMKNFQYLPLWFYCK